MRSKKKYFVLLVLFIITINLVIGYSARSEEEDKMALASRKEKDVRITRIAFKSGINDAISNYDTYTDSSIMMNFELPKENSTVTYVIQITNIGDADVVLSQISNLPDNLEYSLKDYTLNEKICDGDKYNNGIVKEFELTIKYKKTSITTTTNFDINLGFEFKRFYDISYEGIDGNYPSEVLEGEPLNVNFGSNAPDAIEVKKDNKITKDYTYQNGALHLDKVDGTIFVTKYIYSTSSDEGFDGIYKEKILNGADPILEGDLIPVTIDDDGTVHYASLYSEWYKYGSQRWANAVILVGDPSKSYKVGDIILEQDIESYFVWVPRYKYKIWNVGNYTSGYQLSNITDNSTDSATQLRHITGNARKIEIVFESKNETPSTGSTVKSYLTHPAFTTLDVNGLWVGKFETGYNQNSNTESPITTDNIKSWTTENAQKEENNAAKIIVKPNVYSWRNNTVGNIFFSAYDYNRTLDSHMMKNTEWGAVAYLSHSQYGIGAEVNINNNSAYLTGCSAAANTDQSGIVGESGTEPTVTQPYNSPTGYHASTTGNITGVYDMSGGAWEYMAAYIDGFGVNSNENVTSGFSLEDLTTYEKYFDKYNASSDGRTYNYRILGDATGEMGPFYLYYDKDQNRRYHNGWYADYSDFVTSTWPWFYRGGFYNDGVLAGVFYFGRYTGGAGNYGSRLVLSPKEFPTNMEFDYTGIEDTYIVPVTGYYKLEVWGSQGSGVGGKGGYSVGTAYLEKGQELYINVGGMNGYNGGGTGPRPGGGATHIATQKGLLSSLENDKETILIVAGGGGGGDSANYAGGAGGGVNGIQGNGQTAGKAGNGGTQDAGGIGTGPGYWSMNGTFGKGGNIYATDNSNTGGGGGGGYYGGASGTSGGDRTAGGGGSGYVNVKLLKNANTIDGNRSMPTHDGTTNMTGNVGNGYAKITLVEDMITTEENFYYTGQEQFYTVPVSGYYKLEVWGAQGGAAYSTSTGGKGGYSVGAIYLEKNQTIYITVGSSNGYNGGGTGPRPGGGATHIATQKGLLSSLEDAKETILIVAGGGGGNSSGGSIGGAGGGITGIKGNCENNSLPQRGGNGGTQDAGGLAFDSVYYARDGAFGQGGDIYSSDSSVTGGAGGGGYYGGASGTSGGVAGAGGGGSGYVGGVTNYGGVTAQTIAGNQAFPNIDGTANETGHAGHGAAKITFIK